MKTAANKGTKQVKDMTSEERMRATLEAMRLDMIRQGGSQERDPR